LHKIAHELKKTICEIENMSITEIKEGFGNTPDSSIGLTNSADRYGRYVSGAIYSLAIPLAANQPSPNRRLQKLMTRLQR